MQKLWSKWKYKRRLVSEILVITAAFSLIGAVVLETFITQALALRPLPFVGGVVALKLGLFFLAPWQTRSRHKKSKKSGVKAAKRSIMLWDTRDPRLDVSLFDANVPSFVLSADQKILDCNAAFRLMFGSMSGRPVVDWYAKLDNFRRPVKRTDELYGEALLPLADRLRVVFVSLEFGRIVMTKLMNPVVDRKSGRIIGWVVVLNVNSVTNRQKFLERLQAIIHRAGEQAQYAASFDAVMRHCSPYEQMIAGMQQYLRHSQDIACFGGGTGRLCEGLTGKNWTIIDSNKELLRQAKHKRALHGARLMHQPTGDFEKLPTERFDAIAVLLRAGDFFDIGLSLRHLQKALKPGGLLIIGMPPLTKENFASLRAKLESDGELDILKYQFPVVEALSLENSSALPNPRLLQTVAENLGFKVEAFRDFMLLRR